MATDASAFASRVNWIGSSLHDIIGHTSARGLSMSLTLPKRRPSTNAMRCPSSKTSSYMKGAQLCAYVFLCVCVCVCMRAHTRVFWDVCTCMSISMCTRWSSKQVPLKPTARTVVHTLRITATSLPARCAEPCPETRAHASSAQTVFLQHLRACLIDLSCCTHQLAEPGWPSLHVDVDPGDKKKGQGP